MKRALLSVAVLALAILACEINSVQPTMDIHAVETIAAATLTALAPTQGQPPTLMPVPTFTLVPQNTPIPTQAATTAGTGPIRIEFAQGATSATVQGAVTFPARVHYLLRALGGQQMTVQISSPNNAANFSILGTSDNQPLKRLENEDRTWSGNLPITQDYQISVAAGESDGSVPYTMTIVIVWP